MEFKSCCTGNHSQRLRETFSRGFSGTECSVCTPHSTLNHFVPCQTEVAAHSSDFDYIIHLLWKTNHFRCCCKSVQLCHYLLIHIIQCFKQITENQANRTLRTSKSMTKIRDYAREKRRRQCQQQTHLHDQTHVSQSTVNQR